MDIKVIRSSDEHRKALREAERLVMADPGVGTPEGERLELLALLIEDFEKRHFPVEKPDPVEAIEFRMNELGLRQKDLVPFLGSRSRVSEVLSRNRPLTVQMIRSISEGLGIPSELLVAAPRPPTASAPERESFDWAHFPFKEMERRGWFGPLKVKAKGTSEDILKAFFAQLRNASPAGALFRRTLRGEVIADKAYYATIAWCAFVLLRGKEAVKLLSKFDPSRLNIEVLRGLAKLSWFENGPLLAIEYLAKYGIAVVVEPRLSGALIDGAAMLTEDKLPIIGLTLRIDRVDYFWFTLLHEVVHVWKHIEDPLETFVDRVENMGNSVAMDKEANRIAKEVFVPRAIWSRSPASIEPTKENIQELADELHIHPAIIAGRLQFETGRYESFREFLGQDSVRKCFPKVAF